LLPVPPVSMKAERTIYIGSKVRVRAGRKPTFGVCSRGMAGMRI
jgi:hypothetical protein